MIDPVKITLRWPSGANINKIANQLQELLRVTGTKPRVECEGTTDGLAVQTFMRKGGKIIHDPSDPTPDAYATPADVTITGNTPDGTHNVAYAQDLTLVGGTAPFTITATTLPTSITAVLSAARTIHVSGVHVAANTQAFAVSGVDANGRPWSYTDNITWA